MWDPNCVGLHEELEKVQHRAARFVTADYNYEPGSMTKIMNQVGWNTLVQRMKEARLVRASVQEYEG